MTEELKEEAEDYANRTRIKDKNTYVSFDDECISSLQDYEGNYMDISERIVKTYIDSAEPREKRIAELEKENAELKEVHESDKRSLRLIAEKGADLEKENTELRDYRLTTLAKQQTSMSKYALNLEHKLSWYDDQLTKAKELLKDITSSYGSTEVSEAQLYLKIKKAEQFLGELK